MDSQTFHFYNVKTYRNIFMQLHFLCSLLDTHHGSSLKSIVHSFQSLDFEFKSQRNKDFGKYFGPLIKIIYCG